MRNELKGRGSKEREASWRGGKLDGRGTKAEDDDLKLCMDDALGPLSTLNILT